MWLGGIVAVALLLRSLSLLSAMHSSSDPWVDPDDFSGQAQRFVADTRAGHWALRAFMYGPLVKAPLYTFVLSVFARFPAYPLSAILMQIGLGTAAIAGLYVIGREAHSARAGLIAAAVYALWLPVLSVVPFFLQEQLHVPLVIVGLALFLRAVVRTAHPIQFAVAGGVLGLSALARSMPLYYVGPAALLHVALAPDRRIATRQALALLLGFLVVILPWCVYISARTGQIILIDNMGSAALGVTYKEVRPELHTAPPASVIESLRMVWLAASRDPLRFWGDRVADFQRLFRLVGGQWLASSPPVASRAQALALKSIAHASDALFALSAVLAPLGVLLARRRREVILVALWVGLHLGLLVTFAWNGVRYRAPYEPELIALAAVVTAGGWVRPRRLALGLALFASLAIGAATLLSLPGTANERAAYGFKEWMPIGGGAHRASIVGEAGFSMRKTNNALDLKLSPAQSVSPEVPVRVRLFLDGREVDQVRLESGERQLRYPWANPLAYVELHATLDDSSRPAPLLVDVVAPRR